MKLKRLEIDGFGKLVKQDYDFCPGLNLIYGKNEAGKSTLQRSILAALYGFFDNGTITAAKKEIMAVYEPWNVQAAFGLNLIFELDGGKQYRVKRTFGRRAETMLYDHLTGEILNAQFPSVSQGRLFFAEQLLGMPREVFENTSLIRQAELAALEKSASAITDTLLRLSASASQESTVSQALEILEMALKERIGTQRSRSKPLPEAQNRLKELRLAREGLISEHQELSNQMHELAQAEENFQNIQRSRNKAEYQRLLSQKQVLQQQMQMINQSDAEVERCQQTIINYQTWANFPSDTQPKIQRLAAQYEKAQSDILQSELVARESQQQITALQLQFEAIHKTLNSSWSPRQVPEIAEQPVELVSDIWRTWSNEELLNLRNVIKEKEDALILREEKLSSLLRIGHESISKYRQNLGRLEAALAQAQREAQQIELNARQNGMPEDQWTLILADAQEDAEKWQGWENFPAHLRDELLQLCAQHSQLKSGLSLRPEEVSEIESKLQILKAQIDTLEQTITDFQNVRNIPHQEKPRMQEIASQLISAKQVSDVTQHEFSQFELTYSKSQQAFDIESQEIQPLQQIGIAGLNQLQQRWLNATQQVRSAQARFEQSKQAWEKVGMPVAEFQRLENTVKEIQSGIRKPPKPRRGCRSLLLIFKRVETVDQTPTEITVYGQVQPIYAEFVRQHDEINNCQSVLSQVMNDIREQLGSLAPDVIEENTFADLIQLLLAHQQKAFEIEQQKADLATRRIHLEQVENNEIQIRSRLESELQRFGFTTANIEDRLKQFFIACDKKEQLILAEAELERVNAQADILKQKLDQHKLQRKLLQQTEDKIYRLLANASIPGVESVTDGINQFEEGVENHHKWKESQARLAQVKAQITDFSEKLTRARSVITESDKNLGTFRQQLGEELSGLLPNDFTDQHLEQLDADLQAFSIARSEIEKAQSQLDQLQLQIQAIQRNMNDWLEKTLTAKRLSDEILQVIQSAGIEVDQISVSDALENFDKAYNGFLHWQEAQRLYDAAVQSQQAIRSSLPRLETELADLNAKVGQFLEQYPEWKNLTVSDKPEVYERNAHKLNDQMLQERDRVTRLQDAVNRGVTNLRHIAELDEEIDLADAEVQRLSAFGQALELAISELTNATSEFQKMFAPRLESIVESGLDVITDRRYRQVKIDPETLNVKVLSPERNEFVETSHLSTGTRDLIYFVLRLGITQLMSNSGEQLPLLLDDPLVEFDKLRTQAALMYMGKLVEKAQVILFTKEDQTLSWFKESVSDRQNFKLIELM